MARRDKIKKSKKDILDENKTNYIDAGYVLEESDQSATTNGHQAYNFLNGIRSIDANYINNDLLVDKMCADSVISAALDIWTEDALQKDPLTGEIFTVEVEEVENDSVAKKLSDGLSKRLNSLLKKDLNANKYLAAWTKRILKYGNCYLKLDFADKLVDEKLKLKESVDSKNTFTKIANKTFKMLSKDPNLKENYSFDSVHKMYDFNSGSLKEDYIVDIEKMLSETYVLPDNYSNELRESIGLKALKEDVLTPNEEKEQTVRGRWYTEILGHGTNIYELSSKQKVVAYIDRDAPNKFIKPDNIINFCNNTGKHRVSFEVGDIYEDATKKEYYQLERGESFIENAMVAWQVLSALEDILLLTRMTRSILYRIFSVQVGNKGNKETAQILDRLKNRLKMEETVDIRSRIYSSTLTQVPLADSIFIPMHGETGAIDVKVVGGDVNLKDAIDLDYFRDKLHSALRIPAPYLSYTESLPGGIGDSSLTRMDIRYSRTIARIQSILAEGLRDICIRYLILTIGEKAFDELPAFKIKFTSINSAEDASRAELQQTFMKTLGDCVNGLAALGIDLKANPEAYTKTRDILLNQYFGSTITQAIKSDETMMSVSSPEELATDKSSPNDGPVPDIEGPDVNVNVGGANLGDEEMVDEPSAENDLDTELDSSPEEGPVIDNTNELS